MELEKSNFKKPLNFSSKFYARINKIIKDQLTFFFSILVTETQHFQAYIDPDNDFDFNDKFSQV